MKKYDLHKSYDFIFFIVATASSPFWKVDPRPPTLAQPSLKILAKSSLKILAEYVIEHHDLIERVWHGTSSNITHKRGSDCARSV